MARAILKIKPPPDGLRGPVEPRNPGRSKRTFIPSKPACAVSCGRSVIEFKPPRVSYDELFVFKPQSIGEKIAIIRAYMYLEGLPPIPEEISISEFATVCARFLLPRYSWPLFEDRQPAEKFIAEWASKLLPLVVNHGPAKPKKAQASWMSSGILAFYDPEIVRARTV